MSYRRATDPLDYDAIAVANSTIADETGGRALSMCCHDTELRQKWMDAYIAAGGSYEELEPWGSGPSDPTMPCKDKPLLTVKLISLTFTSDHGLLTDKFTTVSDTTSEFGRWRPGGTRFEQIDKREWTPGHTHPISHTRLQPIEIIAEFEAGPPDALPSPGLIHGKGSEPYLNFEGSAEFKPTNAARTNTIKVRMKALEPLPDQIRWMAEWIEWQVETCDRVHTSHSGEHEIFVTFDKPRAFNDELDNPEPKGITRKRMDTAVTLIQAVDTTTPGPIEVWEANPAGLGLVRRELAIDRPHAIVNGLMRLFPEYTLEADDDLADFDHPSYFNDLGGAWPLADFVEKKAECQAIVRLVRNLINQVGLPGKAETKYVSARRRAPMVAVENDRGRAYTVGALIDQPIADSDIGRVFPPSHTDIGGSQSMGFNNFEACLKFTHGGKTVYYGGGAAAYLNKEAALRAFHAFVETESAWFPNDSDPDKVLGFRVTKILARYH